MGQVRGRQYGRRSGGSSCKLHIGWWLLSLTSLKRERRFLLRFIALLCVPFPRLFQWSDYHWHTKTVILPLFLFLCTCEVYLNRGTFPRSVYIWRILCPFSLMFIRSCRGITDQFRQINLLLRVILRPKHVRLGRHDDFVRLPLINIRLIIWLSVGLHFLVVLDGEGTILFLLRFLPHIAKLLWRQGLAVIFLLLLCLGRSWTFLFPADYRGSFGQRGRLFGSAWLQV